jgi:hypothetical protein
MCEAVRVKSKPQLRAMADGDTREICPESYRQSEELAQVRCLQTPNGKAIGTRLPKLFGTQVMTLHTPNARLGTTGFNVCPDQF